MATNKIVKYNLESHAKELHEKNKTVREIAQILSKKSGQMISFVNVARYFQAQTKQHRDIVEKNDKLKLKVTELQIDTIARRNRIIERLERVADQAESDGLSKELLESLKVQISALDSLDKRLGNFAPQKLEVEGHIRIFQAPELRRILQEIDAGSGQNSDITDA